MDAPGARAGRTRVGQTAPNPMVGAEQSPEEWWQALVTASRRLLSSGLVSPSDVKAICCSTQGEGTGARSTATVHAAHELRSSGWTCGAPYLNQAPARRRERGRCGRLQVDPLHPPHRRHAARSPAKIRPAQHASGARAISRTSIARTYKFLNVLDYLNLRLTGQVRRDLRLDPHVVGDRQPRPGRDLRYSD